jgi:hypothetical protein
MTRTTEPHHLNKVVVGDKIQATDKLITWHATNSNFCYKSPSDQEIPRKYLKDFYFWLHCYVNKIRPEGKVTIFGSEEDDSPRLNVGVELKLGRRKQFLFVSEDDITKI